MRLWKKPNTLRRLLAVGVCLLTVSSVARADSLDEQRSRYAQIKQAQDNRQMDVVEQMMHGLKDYPLYPYPNTARSLMT